jgi:DNA-binding SARP family transcriptional activator/tetratricopeptide (TPR) repeat protein
MMLRVKLLGELQADVDGRAVQPPASRRAWSLLGWLALHPGEHPRGTVAAQFWPDVLDASARGSLRNAIWALRRALGAGDALTAGRDRIGLQCATDLADFEAHLAAGRCADAAALCRGPLLADLDEDWVLEARDEHAAKVGGAFARLAASAAAPADAVAWARRRVALDPLDEEAARDLIRRLADAGDRAGALAAYDRLAERLRAALALAPAGETRELAAAIRVPAPAGAVGEPVPVARGDPGDEPPLVGRTHDLAVLVELWEHVRAGRGGVAVLRGEGGIGKTRLAAELVTHARGHGARAARCTAVDLGVPPPFGPWAELLAGLGQELDPPAPDAGWPEELGRLAPSLPRRLGRAPAAPADVPADLARTRLFEAAVELVEYATADRPLVLVFDDVNLAGGATLELAAYVARRIARLPVLLLLTRRLAPRRDAVDGLLAAARDRGVAVREVDLDPLDRADVERLVAAIAALDATERDHVIALAEGNPLLALESARAASRGDEGPPSSLRASVRTAIARLAEPARRTAELTAVAARDLDRAELAAVADAKSVLDALECGLLRSAAGRFGYRHALLRDAVYADLDDARRLHLHEVIGLALDASAAEAAHHLKAAGRTDLAAAKLSEAAHDAARATASDAAAAFLRELVELRPDDAQARLRLAGALATLGRREEALAEHRAALERLDPGEATARAHLLAARWFRSSLCDPAMTIESARHGLDALDARGLLEPDLRAELLLLRAWGEVTTVGAPLAERTLAELEPLEAELVDSALYRQDRETVRGFVLLAQGRLAEAEERLLESGRNGALAGRPDMCYGGYANAACVAAAAGDIERALSHADKGRGIVAGLPMLEFHMAVLRASLLARLGRHAEARAEADREAELAARLGLQRLAAIADHDGGLVALLAGELERAQELLGRALDAGSPLYRAEARLRRGEALARLGRSVEAESEIRAAVLEPIRPADRPAVLVARMCFTQALVAGGKGDAELAERRLREAQGHWRRIAGEYDTSREHLASLVDLGRPPLTGVVEPQRELERIAEELLDVDTMVRT